MQTTTSGLVTKLKRQAYLLSALGLVLLGLIALLIGRDTVDWASEIGTTLLSTGLIAVVWQVLVDRWQTQSIRQIVQSVTTATDPILRLREVRLRQPEAAEMQTMLSGGDELLMSCLYDSRWLDPWAEMLKKFVSRGKRVRLVCPDPTDHALMAALASRHQMSDPHRFQAHVVRLVEHLELLEAQHPGQIAVRLAPAPGPAYTSYLVLGAGGRGSGMVRLFAHRMQAGDTLVEQTFDRGGELFEFYTLDFERLWGASTPHLPPPRDVDRSLRVGVIGPGDPDAETAQDARDVGELLGIHPDTTLVTGGLGGVMEAAPAGMARARPDSRRVGYLPGLAAGAANRWINAPIATGLGQARNLELVDNCDAIVAVGFNEGTLMEAAYAHRTGVPVFSIGFPAIAMRDGGDLTTLMPSPRTAVDAALAAAHRRRDARVEALLSRKGSADGQLTR